MIGWEQLLDMGFRHYPTPEFDALCNVYRVVNDIRHMLRTRARWRKWEHQHIAGFFAARAEAAIDGVYRERPPTLTAVLADVRDLQAYCNRELARTRYVIDCDAGQISFKGSAGSWEYAT